MGLFQFGGQHVLLYGAPVNAAAILQCRFGHPLVDAFGEDDARTYHVRRQPAAVTHRRARTGILVVFVVW